MAHKFGRWVKTECDSCGMEFQVTRTEEKIIEGPILCGECTAYAAGYHDGFKQSNKEDTDLPTLEDPPAKQCTVIDIKCSCGKSIHIDIPED